MSPLGEAKLRGALERAVTQRHGLSHLRVLDPRAVKALHDPALDDDPPRLEHAASERDPGREA